MTEQPNKSSAKENNTLDNISENSEKNIWKKIDNVGENSEKNLENKIKLSYQWLKKLAVFISQKQKLSLQETLAEINISKIDISEDDMKQLSTLNEESFQSLKEWFISQYQESSEINENIVSENIDPLTRKIFSAARCQNAQKNINGNISHHIDGVIIWLVQSTIIIWKIVIDITIDILKLPNDLRKILSWECKLPDYNV